MYVPLKPVYESNPLHVELDGSELSLFVEKCGRNYKRVTANLQANVQMKTVILGSKNHFWFHNLHRAEAKGETPKPEQSPTRPPSPSHSNSNYG